MKPVALPKDRLTRVDLGKAFAEYDLLSRDPTLFVMTPASISALDLENRKSFFVGRRGAGKTAIALELARTYKRSTTLAPEVFDLIQPPLEHREFEDTRQRPFKSLSSAFERALLGELVSLWVRDRHIRWEDAGDTMRRERNLIESCDFDLRVLNLCDEIFEAYQKDTQKLWLRQIKRNAELTREVNELATDGNYRYAIIIDRLDEAWSGSSFSITSLMALMHAVVRVVAACEWLRPFVFIRENVYERIRADDNEFSRLETSVAFLDWTEEKLVELIERRCVKPFNTKPKIGHAWPYFFQEDSSFSTRRRIFEVCQPRPRDVLMLGNFAIETAVNRNHETVTEDDLSVAVERYSLSRLKDLGDEYAENYSNIRIVLGFFFGLATEFTLNAVDDLIQKLLVEEKVRDNCEDWFFDNAPPHRFIEILYNIGFMGIRRGGQIHFRDAVIDAAFLPRIDNESTFLIHETYREALNLQDRVLTEIPREIEIKEEGILDDLPIGFSFDGYQNRLKQLREELKRLPLGEAAAEEFERIVGDIVSLCFFRSLTNLEQKVRTVDGKTIKDWIASNQAYEGFWARIREAHRATQVIWECKNYEKLAADDFQQISYYMNDTIGRFALLVFRGKEVSNEYLKHVDRVAHKDRKGVVLILRQNDLDVFLRQAIKGTPREAHISELYDKTVRAIS